VLLIATHMNGVENLQQTLVAREHGPIACVGIELGPKSALRSIVRSMFQEAVAYVAGRGLLRPTSPVPPARLSRGDLCA
jgi:hypothetical protein